VDDDRRERRSERRVRLSEAAELLGVSKDAVRMRVKRGTLRSEKGENGRVYVYLNVVPDADPHTVHPQGEVEAWRELIDELRDRVRSLEDANRENRRIIAALTQRIPELEAPREQAPVQEHSDGPEPASSPPDRGDVPRARKGPQEPTDRVSWWRRVFGS
jgi:excisionase family DNA binding protein